MLGFPQTIAGPNSIADVALGRAAVIVQGEAIRFLDGTPVISGGANVAVTGEQIRFRDGTIVSRGGADVAVTGEAIRFRHGDVTVITVTPQFFDLVTQPDTPGQYLVEVTAIKGSLKPRGGGAGPIADARAIADVRRIGDTSVDSVTLQWSDSWWVGDPAEPAKANEEYEARVMLPLAMDRRVEVEPERSRRVSRQVGFIELANTDGALDSVISTFAIDGQEVLVRYGPLDGEYKDFSTIARMLGVRFDDGGDRLRIAVRDKALPLARQMQSTLYAGTGGQNGTAELQGKGLPQAYGECFNVSPVLLVPGTLTYQVHDGSMEAIDGVFDKGLALALDTTIGTGGNVADYAALQAASPAAGKYVTCLSEGLFRLGGSPSGGVTADVRGDNSSGLYVSNLGDVAQRIMVRKGGLDSAQINASSWDALPAYKVGLFVPAGASKTTEQALDDLVGSIGASWGASRSGLVRAQQIVDPTLQPVQRTFDENDIIDLKRVGPANVRWLQPVGYRKNWTVQKGDELAGTVSDDRRQLLGEPYSLKEASDAEVLSRHVEALSAQPIDSLLVDATDAQSVADDVLAIHSADRDYFDVELKRIGFLSDLLEITQIIWPRFGMGGGRTFAVSGIREDGGNDRVTLRVWG